MKKIRFSAAALLLFVSTSLVSCADDGFIGLTARIAYVTAVTGDGSADVNEEIPLNVIYEVENGCATFNRFVEMAEGTTKVITVEAVYPSQCNDTDSNEARTAVYRFKSAQAGTYSLKFRKSATEFVTHTVVVE